MATKAPAKKFSALATPAQQQATDTGDEAARLAGRYPALSAKAKQQTLNHISGVNGQADARIKRQSAQPSEIKAREDAKTTLRIIENKREVPNVPEGAEPPAPPQVAVIVQNTQGRVINDDQRVKILVPQKYLTSANSGEDGIFSMRDIGGIVFPYTPSITYGIKTTYSEQTPLHSNFSLQFFKNSSVGEISISGKFSVENGADAALYLSTVHLIKSLMRMRSGGSGTGDIDSGAPPPVCRLDAYGERMLRNVPIVLTSFRVELPDNVDYFRHTGTFSGMNTVPTISTIQITCVPIYSRNEMQQFSVDNYARYGSNIKNKGYI